jgi:hypothetical protein
MFHSGGAGSTARPVSRADDIADAIERLLDDGRAGMRARM